jgi:hypothetical protein
MTTTLGERKIRHATQGAGPSQPQRYAAIGEHLVRDRERGGLTLRGPDLRYWLQFATPGEPLREWVVAAVDARIQAATDARLGGARADDYHVCQQCIGRGCEACGEIGLICPMCRGARWLTDGKPTSNRLHLTACPGCMAGGGTSYHHAPGMEASAIQRHIDRLQP